MEVAPSSRPDIPGTSAGQWCPLVVAAQPGSAAHKLWSEMDLGRSEAQGWSGPAAPKVMCLSSAPSCPDPGELGRKGGDRKGTAGVCAGPGRCQPREDLCLRAGQRADATGLTLGRRCREPGRARAPGLGLEDAAEAEES
ncbi:unnamed protein product [Rangifer tarandus platyrhynchus]|uniref:Uncharacterized protein n=1 Tax=Rangifer tarandus platyrhynchus TaxID=3082113 RepID=A0AC59YQR1_RANTA